MKGRAQAPAEVISKGLDCFSPPAVRSSFAEEHLLVWKEVFYGPFNPTLNAPSLLSSFKSTDQLSAHPQLLGQQLAFKYRCISSPELLTNRPQNGAGVSFLCKIKMVQCGLTPGVQSSAENRLMSGTACSAGERNSCLDCHMCRMLNKQASNQR